MAFVFEFLSKLSVIINLTVQGDPNSLVLVRDRLFSCRGKIDDPETCMAEAGA